MVSWKELVESALREPDQISNLFEALKPILIVMAKRIAPQVPEDALQVAYIKIWTVISSGKVDLERLDTIKSLLLRSAGNAMKDERHRNYKSKRGEVRLSDGEESIIELIPDKSSGEKYEFGGLLTEYLDYVTKEGKFDGSHSVIAKNMGVSVRHVISKFHQEADEFLKREQLSSAPLQFQSIIDSILSDD